MADAVMETNGLLGTLAGLTSRRPAAEPTQTARTAEEARAKTENLMSKLRPGVGPPPWDASGEAKGENLDLSKQLKPPEENRLATSGAAKTETHDLLSRLATATVAPETPEPDAAAFAADLEAELGGMVGNYMDSHTA